MRYYAVTDDPNELMHFGIKGMRWGVRRTPEQLGRSRSSAYKKASTKLNKMMKSGIKKAKAQWKTYNSPKAKEERFMKRATEKARNGTLKYGKLTDDQVRRITERLNLESQARRLGSTENPRYLKRIRMAIGEGIVTGIGKGTSSYIDERIKGRGKSTAELRGKKRMLRYESNTYVQEQQAENKANASAYKKRYEKRANEREEQYERQLERRRQRKQAIKTKVRNSIQEGATSIRNRTKGVKKDRTRSNKNKRGNYSYYSTSGYIR